MKIEVTRAAFECLFHYDDRKGNEVKETHETIHFYNAYLELTGFKVWNFASSTRWQYYIQDINY